MRLAYLIGYGVEMEKSPFNRYEFNACLSKVPGSIFDFAVSIALSLASVIILF